MKEFAFPAECKSWLDYDISKLFDVKLENKLISNDSTPAISRNLEHNARKVNELMIWTDCDREGEAIGFDIA